jgi:hypothetical protein
VRAASLSRDDSFQVLRMSMIVIASVLISIAPNSFAPTGFGGNADHIETELQHLTGEVGRVR